MKIIVLYSGHWRLYKSMCCNSNLNIVGDGGGEVITFQIVIQIVNEI